MQKDRQIEALQGGLRRLEAENRALREARDRAEGDMQRDNHTSNFLSTASNWLEVETKKPVSQYPNPAPSGTEFLPDATYSKLVEKIRLYDLASLPNANNGNSFASFLK